MHCTLAYESLIRCTRRSSKFFFLIFFLLNITCFRPIINFLAYLCIIFFTVFLYLLHILHHCYFSEFQVDLHSQCTFSPCLQAYIGTFSLATHNTQGTKYAKTAQIYLHGQRDSSQQSAGSPLLEATRCSRSGAFPTRQHIIFSVPQKHGGITEYLKLSSLRGMPPSKQRNINSDNNKFYIRGSVHRDSILLYINKIQRDATVCRCLFTAKLLYVFRVSIAPIIRSTSNCNRSFWYRS